MICIRRFAHIDIRDIPGAGLCCLNLKISLFLNFFFTLLSILSVIWRGERIWQVDSVQAERRCYTLWRRLQGLRLPDHHHRHLQLLAVWALWHLPGKDLVGDWAAQSLMKVPLPPYLFLSLLLFSRKVWNQYSVKQRKTARARDKPWCADRPFTPV